MAGISRFCPNISGVLNATGVNWTGISVDTVDDPASTGLGNNARLLLSLLLCALFDPFCFSLLFPLPVFVGGGVCIIDSMDPDFPCSTGISADSDCGENKAEGWAADSATCACKSWLFPPVSNELSSLPAVGVDGANGRGVLNRVGLAANFGVSHPP